MASTPKEPVQFRGAGPLNGPISGALTWVDQRFPLMSLWRDHLSRIREVAPQPGLTLRLLYRVDF